MSKTKKEASINSDTLNLNITGRIYQDELANWVRWRVDEALQMGVTRLQVFLSSEGGSCFEAEDIKHELLRIPNRSCKVGAIAASAATNILTIFDTVEAYPSSQFMIHKPSTLFTGNEDEAESDLKLLKNITNTYRTLYARKSGRTEEEIETMWKNDCWMSAEEAKDFKLVTHVLQDALEYDPETVAQMVACGCPVIPQTPNAKTETNTTPTMDTNLLKSALGLPADATEEQILSKAQEVKSKADNAAQIEASVTKQRQESAERVVNAAILDKKITTDMKATYVGLHMQDPVKTEEILAAMHGVQPASAGIANKADGATGRENWTIEDYLSKDPDALDELTKTDPEKVQKLNAAYAKKH